MKSFLLTLFALVAFAFNSILCRMALRGDEADPVAFTEVRLISAAATLILISYLSGKAKQVHNGPWNWRSAIFLYAYAICFSFAYIGLSAGTGALILFGTVQMTMIASSIIKGVWPSNKEWLGLCVSVAGLVYLVFPGLESPSLLSSSLMIVAGMAWGAYTLRGKGSKEPLAETTSNFILALFPSLGLVIVFSGKYHITDRGIILAMLSGAVASGVGYTIWYTALKFHTATRAAVLQLSVPVIAAVGGIVFLAETFSTRLLAAGIMIILGIGMTIAARTK